MPWPWYEGKLLEPLHGSRGPIERAHTEEALVRARSVLEDQNLLSLLARPRGEVAEPGRAIYVNRNLRMANVSMIGFDMDYTLAIYHQRRIEQLSFDLTVRKLVDDFGYPKEIETIKYDGAFVMRGLFVDKRHGNLIKIDRFGHVGRAYHGRRLLPDDEMRKLYRNERIRLKNPEYAWIDTLFALPEACLFADTIALLETKLGQKLEYAKLYDDIRSAIDTVHRDNSLKQVIRADIGRYIFKDPELGPALHKLRSGGKKLFVLTNSLWDYTEAVMKYLLDGVLPEYPSWRNYFDVVVTGASKPGFFSEQKPFLEVDAQKYETTGEATSLERGKIYQGGNLGAFERLTGSGGETVLYVGDHIYGDILKSRKTSMWRTCMIVQELEDELNYTEALREEILKLSEIEMLQARIDDEVSVQKVRLNHLEKRLEREELSEPAREKLDQERREAKHDLDKLRRSAKECAEIGSTLEKAVEGGFNPSWGLLFKEGPENSRFGEQVEQYACLYTSRVSNFVFYSPMQYFRSPRDQMAHELAGAVSGKLSPFAGEGPPKGTNRAE